MREEEYDLCLIYYELKCRTAALFAAAAAYGLGRAQPLL